MEKEYTIEEQIIIDQAKANGTYLKAPNGEDTNLSPRQWLQVRTAAFKEWFGDWENDKEKASKILDRNGEPVVMYHGTPLSRNQITPNKGWQKDGLTYIPQTPPFNIFKGGDYSGLIFTSVDYDKAASIAEKRAMSIPDDENGNEQFSDQGYVYELYLNSKKTFDVNNEQDLNEILDSFNGDIPTLNFYGGKGNYITKEEATAIVKRGANTWLITETPEFINKVKALGYDGLAGIDEWVKYVAVFNPNQIKSASANIGAFSLDNDDIRYRFIGEKGAANLDRAEEATFRLDNLAVAREDVRREDQLFLQNSFSASMCSDKAELIPVIESLASSIHTPIEIISDINDITAGAVRKEIESGHNVKGWFIPASNKVAVYLLNMRDMEDAQSTVFHEAVAHYGLRKMFGEHFNTFLDNVYNNASEEIQGRIMYATHGQPSKRLIATEEYLAKLAEQGFNDLHEISFWKKVKLAFVDMLHHAGVSLGFKLHDNDLRGIIFKSYQNLAHKGFDDNLKSLSKDDKLYLAFKAAVENNDYNKFIELKEQGYYPSKEVIQSLASSFSGSASITVQKIFGIEMSAIPIRPLVLNLPTNDLKHHLPNVVEQSL